MKDERITIDSKETVNNVVYIRAHLIPNEDIECPDCKSKQHVKNGTVCRNIKEKIFTDYSTKLILTVQKFRCKYCNRVFQDSTPIVESNSNITVHLKMAILNDLRSDISLSFVADKYHLSVQTIYDIFEAHVYVSRHKMPEVLCIDEFKNLKSEDGKYAVVLYDPMHSKIIDIIENRRLETLDEYFFHIDEKELKNVKYFISDMYEPFRSIKKKFFPQATHIVDHFHFARYVYDAFDKERIRIMNTFQQNTKEYRILKKYWHIFIKKASDLKEYDQYNPIKKKKTKTSEIISDSLELSDSLYLAYGLKELFIHEDKEIHFETRKETINKLIRSFKESELEPFISLAGMFENWFEEIGNSYIRFGDKRLNNAYLEGKNNRIKEIKKLSYGCESFYYLRNRVMFIINENEPIGRVDTSKIPRLKRK